MKAFGDTPLRFGECQNSKLWQEVLSPRTCNSRRHSKLLLQGLLLHVNNRLSAAEHHAVRVGHLVSFLLAWSPYKLLAPDDIPEALLHDDI